MEGAITSVMDKARCSAFTVTAIDATPYLDLSWRAGGRDETGVDCWGLVRLIYAREIGLTLPLYSEFRDDRSGRARLAARSNSLKAAWQPLAEPFCGAVVEVAIGGRFCHVGIMIDRVRMLHTLEGLGACVDPVAAPLWRKRILGYWSPGHTAFAVSANGARCGSPLTPLKGSKRNDRSCVSV